MHQAEIALGYIRHPSRIFYGWKLVGLSLFLFGVVLAPTFLGLGTFFVALERHFGWSRAALSGAFSLSRVEGALLGPIEGYMTDRMGARRVILIGLLILGVGLVTLAFIRNLIDFYVAFLIIFTGAGLGGFIPLMSLINNWFTRRRALATAIGMSGNSVGGLIVPILAFSITSFGWQSTAFSLGIIILALAFPVTKVIRNRPEEYGLLPDGDLEPEQSTEGNTDIEPADTVNFTMMQALKTWAFWTIAITHGLGATAFVTITIHVIPALTDTGMSLQMASTVVATYTTTAVVVQVFSGFLGDRFPKPPLIAMFITIQGFGILILAMWSSLPMAFLFAFIFGIGFGGRVPLLVSIRGEYFGKKAFGAILGMSQVPMNIIMVAAPVLAGRLYDTQGSYLVPFVGLSVVCFAGAILILTTRKPNLTNS